MSQENLAYGSVFGPEDENIQLTIGAEADITEEALEPWTSYLICGDVACRIKFSHLITDVATATDRRLSADKDKLYRTNNNPCFISCISTEGDTGTLDIVKCGSILNESIEE